MTVNNRKHMILCVSLAICLFLSIILSFGIGRYSGARLHNLISLVFTEGKDASSKELFVLFRLRWPRIIAAAFVGASISVSGTVYQALFANPIVSPDNLGVSYGASFGAVIGLLLGVSSMWMKGIAFLTGCIAVLLVYLFSRIISNGGNLTIYLVLIGMVISSIFSALLSAAKYIADPEDQLPQITYWLMGSFSKVQSDDILVVGIVFLIGIVPIFILRWRLNLLTLSDEEAASMGVNKRRLQAIVVLCATLLTSISTSITGGINWVGLIVPHFARLLGGNDYRRVTVISALLGANMLVLLDDLARSISINEIPISILTSLIGAPLFLILLVKNREKVIHGY